MMLVLALLAVVALGGYVALVFAANRRIHPKTGEITPTDQQTALPDGSGTLSVLTWNVGYGGLGKRADLIVDSGRSLRALSAPEIAAAARGIADWLAANESDVICLQECANAGFLTRAVPLRRIITQRLAGRQSAFWTDMRSLLVPRFLHVDHGMSVHSRIRLRACRSDLLPQDDTYFFGILKKHYGVVVSRFAAAGTGRDWVVFNIHLSAFDTDGAAREEQLHALIQRALGEYNQGHYVVIGGDWNMRLTPTDFAHEADPATLLWAKDFPTGALPPEWQLAVDPVTPTVRSLNSAYAPDATYTTIVDGFVFSPNVALKRIATTDMGFEFSDHQPVEAGFAVRD